MKKQSKIGIGRRLRQLRESLEITQGELADAAGMDQSLLSKYEREDVSPSWLQIERLLDSMGQSPCALFPDLCSSRNENEDGYFSVTYFSGTPHGIDGMTTATTKLHFHRDSPMVRLLHLPPESDRYLFKRAEQDAMIPDWYPGDLLVIDTKPGVKPGKVVAGFLDGEPMARRLVRDSRKLLLVASNRYYPPVPFEEERWQHIGQIVYAVRDLAMRYSGEV